MLELDFDAMVPKVLEAKLVRLFQQFATLASKPGQLGLGLVEALVDLSSTFAPLFDLGFVCHLV